MSYDLQPKGPEREWRKEPGPKCWKCNAEQYYPVKKYVTEDIKDASRTVALAGQEALTLVPCLACNARARVPKERRADDG